ncbi:immunoglobulin superfamily member 10 [Pygocentrus nattereri]|uniref:Ig-like domain-containing protein n=1 Tax=Pygocentrus nattereri TaxID=42514 RepID=A0A3B4BVG9_PYGNA|nr:immunoglobulin superfamily member 10 [Pygocentrus nattereri]
MRLEWPSLRCSLLALHLLLAEARWSGACPTSCACYVPTEVHCTFRYLSTMPREIQPAVERINLGYNSLSVIKENELSGLTNLELLMLHSNLIQDIENKAFHHLKALQVLKMSYNRVKELRKETFQGLDNLLRLHMDHNRIEFIHPEAFYGLTSLQLVHLEGNLLQQLHPDTFITLRHSQIFKFSSIKTIYLSDNLLFTLPSTVFSGCYQLENLFLNGNPWSCDCRMDWFAEWMKKNPGILKCKRDRKFPGEQLCPVCESPVTSRGSNMIHLDAYTCSKPWIHPHLKQKNITMDENSFAPVFPKDFIAPIGMIEMNITDQFHNDANIACVVQRPTGLENLNVTHGVKAEDVTTLIATVATSLVCNIDYEHIRQLWGILATYSDSPMTLERGLLLAMPPDMIYKYKQARPANDEIFTEIEANIKANPAWLMQDVISLQLDRTTTTYSTLHIKYSSNVEMNVEANKVSRDRYSWTMIKRDNQTKTESSVLSGGLAELNCQTYGDPKPSTEWILPDGIKVRAPYTSEDQRIVIADNGKLTLRAADSSDAGVYRCIATNYLDADVLSFRVTVLSPDVEEEEINGVQLLRSVGESLFLDCETTGSPQASVQWILPDHTVLDRSYGNRKLYQNGTLKIHGLTERDRGFYRCIAANHIGVDLLASLVTISNDGSKRVRLIDLEGSGDDVQPNTEDPHKNHSEHLSRVSQESRTVTSDRPYPRLRSSLRRVPTMRRGGSRHPGWTRRVFDKTSRKVDPEKLANFIKRSQNNKQGKAADGEIIPLEDSKALGDETGSGNEGIEGNIFSPSHDMTITGNTENNYVTIYDQRENNQKSGAMITEVVRDDPSNFMTTPGHINTISTDSYSYTDATPVQASVTLGNYEIQSDETTPFMGYTIRSSDRKFYSPEIHTFKPLQPVTLKFTVTESMDKMELQFSGDTPETATEIMPNLNSQSLNVTRMMDRSAQRVNPVVHTSTDHESQTTFTAVTTTEREQDEITFHTTQRIKSPRLPPGSTIISHQQIHIIPPNKKRPGRRRNFPSRRRFIRPNKITDIQSLLDKFKRPSVKHEGNATVPYTVELTTDCELCGGLSTIKSRTVEEQSVVRPTSSLRKTEIPKPTTTLSTPFVTSPKMYTTSSSLNVEAQLKPKATSAFAPEQEPTQDPMKVSTTVIATTTTTKSSKVIRGKIPWHKLFGSKESQREILNRLRKPAKPSTTTQSTTSVRTMTTTPPSKVTATLPTGESIVAPMTASPPVAQENSETSSDDISGSSSFTESQASFDVIASFTTAGPFSNYHKTAVLHSPATTPTYGSRLSTTTESQITPILPAPPTTRTMSKEDSLESSTSGSDPGESAQFVGRSWRNRKPGFHRRRFRGRRPIKKTTTQAPTTRLTTLETTSLVPQTESSLHRPLYTPAGETVKSSKPSITKTSKSSNSEERDNSAKTTISPKISTTSESIPTYPTSTPRPYTTPQSQIRSNKRGGGRYQTQRPVIRRVRPKVSVGKHTDHLEQPRPRVSSAKHKDRSKDRIGNGKTITFDTVTVLKAEESYKSTSVPYNSDLANSLSNTYDETTVYDTTLSNAIGLESTTIDMNSKPRILGGNAASFTVDSNSDAFLPCEVTGNPAPAISWKRFSSSTGSTLTIKGKMGKFEVFKNGTLLIQNANVKDRGQYLCLAENDYGSDKLLVMLSVLAYPSQILEPKVREIKVHSGEAVEMRCKTEGRPVPVVSWILANRTQVRGQNNDQGRVKVTPEGTLVIQQVFVYDRGHYKCIASNPAGVDTATVRLQVVAAPPGILEEKRQLVRVDAGQSVWIPCTSQGDPQPTVHWVLFDGTIVRAHNTHLRAFVFPNGTFHMKNLDISDSGKYECIATSSTGSERRVVTLSVEKTETAPQINEISDRRTELEYGGQLQLNCSATGNPKPRIIWRLPSKALVDQWHRMGSRIQVLQNGTLIIDSVSEKDAGDYLCVARSKVGDDLQLLKVSVSMKPAKIEPKVVGKKQVPYGKDIKVDCKASGAPIPDISWGLPDGTLVNSALQADSSRGSRSKRYVLFDNGTLYLNKVGMDEEGDYTCYAENKLGKDEMHVHITVVTAAPRIRPPRLTYAKVRPGGNIRFDCEAVGEPKPKILWMLPSSDMIAASNERYLMHVNGSLDIRDVKLVDAGEYVCMARNTAGDESKVYKIDIDGNPPVINGYYQNRTVVKHTAPKYSRKLIDCKAEGDPPPRITWIMPDNIFLSAPYYGSRINVHPNGTLEIRNVRPTDTAEFICMARNDGGEAVMVVQLEVTSQLMRPIFKNPFNERLVTRLGKTTILNCSADGQPPPDIIWTLPNGTQLIGGPSRGAHHHLGKDGTFVIYNPSKEDAGKYRCAAKNKVGYIEKLIVLEVGQKPYILTRPRGIIRSMSGEPLFLHCLADASPRPTIIWTIPGGHVLNRPQSAGRYQLMDNGTLVIYQTKLHDRGNYVCRAKNDAGEAMLTIPVVIIAYPPRITNGPPPTLKKISGSPVHLNCFATGIPKPEISWELPDRSVLSTAGKGRPAGSELLHPQGTLIIQKPTVTDSGHYKCLASNYLGTDTRTTYMRVM